MWHLLKLAQLIENDLNRIAGEQGLSLADFHLLGALMMEAPRPMRATDLAHALNVSNTVLTGRVRRLAEAGLLRRDADAGDRRSTRLALTGDGERKVRDIGRVMETNGRFVAELGRLTGGDQQTLSHILRSLHIGMERHFLPRSRPE
ncbi:MarR family transcriptional regulator [Sphingosinithalassobacter tenebrarum]|uniref:MarR family transcriptional regulator n=2 Tax=Stakelama tenebrarum TaxID=2711215 RepID=A0A6G6YA99_9SPHN|nr:MarR family transcriptional regulator [Sphingosinithalassobacter tenebrarum]